MAVQQNQKMLAGNVLLEYLAVRAYELPFCQNNHVLFFNEVIA